MYPGAHILATQATPLLAADSGALTVAGGLGEAAAAGSSLGPVGAAVAATAYGGYEAVEHRKLLEAAAVLAKKRLEHYTSQGLGWMHHMATRLLAEGGRMLRGPSRKRRRPKFKTIAGKRKVPGGHIVTRKRIKSISEMSEKKAKALLAKHAKPVQLVPVGGPVLQAPFARGTFHPPGYVPGGAQIVNRPPVQTPKPSVPRRFYAQEPMEVQEDACCNNCASGGACASKNPGCPEGERPVSHKIHPKYKWGHCQPRVYRYGPSGYQRYKHVMRYLGSDGYRASYLEEHAKDPTLPWYAASQWDKTKLAKLKGKARTQFIRDLKNIYKLYF